MFRRGMIILAIFFSAIAGLKAQKTTDLSTDPKLFPAQLKALFSQDNHPEVKALMDEFEEQWVKKNEYTASEQSIIINRAISMQQQKTRP